VPSNPTQPNGARRARWGKVSVSRHEHRFLSGPRSRMADGIELSRIAWDFLRGFRILHSIGPCVTVFGSARFAEGHPYYRLARETGSALARAGFTVMTGGGPGIMEAANRGAWESGGTSVGVNIDLPHEQRPNRYLDIWASFRYFHVRKVMLIKYSCAFVVLPGGFGTMDEIYDTTTLIQTGKIASFPVVIMGRAFWAPLMAFMNDRMLAEGTIDDEDLERIAVTDSPNEATEIILSIATERFGVHLDPDGPRRRRRGEGTD
jgi:uncharacterized protein (TIGR00730 family)